MLLLCSTLTFFFVFLFLYNPPPLTLPFSLLPLSNAKSLSVPKTAEMELDANLDGVNAILIVYITFWSVSFFQESQFIYINMAKAGLNSLGDFVGVGLHMYHKGLQLPNNQLIRCPLKATYVLNSVVHFQAGTMSIFTKLYLQYLRCYKEGIKGNTIVSKHNCNKVPAMNDIITRQYRHNKLRRCNRWLVGSLYTSSLLMVNIWGRPHSELGVILNHELSWMLHTI